MRGFQAVDGHHHAAPLIAIWATVESCCPDIETISSRGSFFVGPGAGSELNPHDEDVVGLFLIALPSLEFSFKFGFLERQAIVA